MDRDLYLEQQALEQEQADRGVAIYFSSRDRLPPSFGSPERKTLSCHLHTLRDKIEDLQLRVAQGERMNGVKHWGMVILSLPAEKLAIIALNVMWNCQSQTLTSSCFELAEHVKQERRLDNIRQTAPDIYSKIKRFKNRVTGSSFYKVRNQIKGVDESWTTEKKLWVGHILIETTITNTDLFYIQSRKRQGKGIINMLYVDPDALKRVEDSHEDLSLLHPQRMPMVVKPVDWKDRWNGGYLSCMDKESCHTPLLSDNFWMSLPHDGPEDFGHHLTAVNILQKTKWRINKRLFDVGYHVFHNNLELGEMLRRDPDPLPPKPLDYDENEPARLAWKEAARQTFRRNERLMGLRTALLTAFDQAKRFQQYDQFYYVWFLDFRGRMYPRGGALTPQGAEYCKALLEFKEGVPLGERGYYWLTIHLANCLGFDKLKYEERIKKVHELKEDIFSWADSPLEYKAWAGMDSPYMALAASFEWADATRSKDPYAYVSHLPVNMDGTTNGLQHLSALGRDAVGAKATNLCITENPNDIYRQVAGECNKIIEKDYDEWLTAGAPTVESVRTETSPATIARLRKLVGSANWRGRVDRKVTKRGVMTCPYGVTRQGVRRQLIADQFLDFAISDPNMDVNIAADYMRDAIWEGQKAVLGKARDIMNWLQAVAISAAEEDLTVSWRSPAGMLIDQAYEKKNRRQIYTAVREYTIWERKKERELARGKQRNGVAPNFIHSLDASHLVFTVMRLHELGITDMMMIHDSYGVHAAHVDTLQRVIREEFVKLHEQDILGDFKKGVEAYVERPLPPLPEVGDYDIQEMLKAEYAFC